MYLWLTISVRAKHVTYLAYLHMIDSISVRNLMQKLRFLPPFFILFLFYFFGLGVLTYQLHQP